MKFFKKMSFIFLGIILISIIFILYFLFRRDAKEWTENITTAVNIEVPVELMSSQRGYFGGHGLGWGGGNRKGSVEFDYDGIHYKNKVPYTPISIRYENKYFYIIYYDRETDFNKITFRFFKSTNKGYFEEIKASEFPKHLAVQNRWFTDDEERNKTEQLKLDKIQGSLTAKIWYQLEKGKEYYEMPSYIPLEFLEIYKKKHLEEK